MGEFRVYYTAFKAALLARLEYRGDVILSSLGGIFFQLGPLLAYGVLSHYAPELGGWKKEEMLFLFGMWALCLGISELFFNNIWDFGMQVINGAVDRLLVYPVRSLPFYLVCSPTLHSFANILAGTLMVGFSLVTLDLPYYAWLMIPFWAACGTAIYTATLVILASTSTYAPNVGGDLLWFLAQLNWAARYPLNIYPFALRVALLSVPPLAAYHYLPGEWLFHQAPLWQATLAPLGAALGISYLAVKMWEFGLNRYESTGS